VLLGGPSQGASSFLGSVAVQKLVAKMEKKRNRYDEAAFVRLLFYQMHRQVLRQFKADALLDETLRTGAYNCLSGTALFALVLDYFKLRYHIAETNYHVFILAEIKGQTWLIEITDPINGLVTKPELVEKRIATYRTMPPPVGSVNSLPYAYRKDYFNLITVRELYGLDYFNRAVQALNAGQLKSSVYLLQQAAVYYYSERISEVAGLLGLMVEASNLPENEKINLQRRLVIMQQPLFASAAK
jgi:hypothetical protein